MKTTCMLPAFALTLFALPPIAQAVEFDVTLVSLTSPAHAGQHATLVIKTAAHARCQVNVGESKTQGLSPKSADRQGRASWTWRVDSNAAEGNWPIAVACSVERKKGGVKSSFKATMSTELIVK